MRLQIDRRSGNGLAVRRAIEITSDEERKLNEVHRAFIEKITKLPENQRSAVIDATASNILGTADPLTSAVAKQLRDVGRMKDGIAAARAEIAEIERTNLDAYHPRDPHRKGRLLARKADLEQQIQLNSAQALALAEDRLERAREEAAAVFRQREAEAAKASAVLDAADRLRQEAEAADVEAKARALVNGERTLAGKKPIPAQGE